MKFLADNLFFFLFFNTQQAIENNEPTTLEMLQEIGVKEAKEAEQKNKKREKNTAEDQAEETTEIGNEDDEDYDDYDDMVSFFGICIFSSGPFKN